MTRAAEPRCLASVFVLMLAPVAVCGLWTTVAHIAAVGGQLSAPSVILSGTLVALGAFLPHAVARRSDDHVALLSVVLVAAIAAPVTGGRLWWLLLPVLLVVGAGSAWAFRAVVSRLPDSFDGRARLHPLLAGLWLLAAMVAVVQSNRMSVFMTDPGEMGYSLMPGIEVVESHSCFSAYVHGAGLARDGHDNVYDFGAAPESATTVDISPFDLDTYGYPPPFLLLPRLFLTLTGDFVLLRAWWYVLTVLIMAVGWVVAVGWLEGRDRHQMIKFVPLVWISMPVQFTLQTGNFQIAAVFMAILAMIAVDRRRVATGGSLLAFTTLAKFSPGLLALALVAGRKLRAAAWTIGFGVVFSLAVLPLFGPAPWEAFFGYHLPRLQSGEALGFLNRSLDEIANNFSPFGIPFKLQQLGLNVGWELARLLGNLYSVILVVLAIVVGRRLGTVGRGHDLRVWLALLTLGALRSPFAPPHVLVGLIWLLVLLSAELRSRWQVAAFATLWILFNVFAPMESVLPAILLSLLRQALLLGGLSWLALRRA